MNRYPEYVEVQGKRYKINTDFRVAIECNRIAEDETIGNLERALGIIETLYGDEGLENSSHYNSLLNLGKKFLLCNKELDQHDLEEPDMDYIEDYGYIWASFMSDYNGMDIDKMEIHWWKFNELMNGLSNSELGDCCVLNRIRNFRRFDLSQIKDAKEREKIAKRQREILLKKNKKENRLTKEQEQSMENLNKLIGL